ncbi:MAG: methionine gamma-lyase family protein [Clostridiales bacterium]|nr:methionine gamma-lyase family protein [Clostridiales bacterium]
MDKRVEKALKNTKAIFETLDKIALRNQEKVIEAFKSNAVALRHFNGTTGYGSDDTGRDTLRKVLASIFNTEDAIVSPSIASGTHAISLALFGVLRPGDMVLSVTGQPYDTLQDTIYKVGVGSLKDFGIAFETIDLKGDGSFDYAKIAEYLSCNKVKMIYLQRSRGYDWRPALSIKQIEELCTFVKKSVPNAIIFCDNCYGEFVEEREPTQVGVDICAGSFIKNIGGGIAPTGGYVVGKSALIELIVGRLTSPSIGAEVGSYQPGYRLFYQGLFLAPHVVNQALKTAILFSSALTDAGYEVSPKVGEHLGDIVCSIKLNDPDKAIAFCQAIQSVSPVDGFVVPEPWEQPGYADKVIMAAGCFVQGASIELSCDGPIRPPYTVYLQGGLTLEHGILALDKVLKMIQ